MVEALRSSGVGGAAVYHIKKLAIYSSKKDKKDYPSWHQSCQLGSLNAKLVVEPHLSGAITRLFMYEIALITMMYDANTTLVAALNSFVSPGLSGSAAIYSNRIGALGRVAKLPPYCIPSRCRHLDILKTIMVN